ncbi:copper amine oxidase [Paenibacillus selenitireducens]|uniref:Copper amine oxidase n=1 Tax=Paenibacillus selenitireducens TaxID=1324314 RepID=A0A1T2XC38_9BACL|nr:stalk domain-containing protein [Paenibacillus selenitireducens]OPA77477.1 copper amine oxidase [Paenibacillus selenitireducens]
MKKWAYLLSGLIIGGLIATTGSAFADQVKSLIGKKVTGEYTVVVNGKTLQDKGAVIDSKTNAPVRALSEALGADVKVEGKTITITKDTGQGEAVTSETNPYFGQKKSILEDRKDVLETSILKPRIEERKDIIDQIEILKKSGADESLKKKEEQLKEYEDAITKYTKELEQVNEALAALEK